MELENSAGKVELGGKLYENPLDDNPIPKRDYREFQVGARTTVREIWLDRVVRDGVDSVHIERDCLQMTNRGVCTIDGRQLKDRGDLERVKEIFSKLEVATR